MEKELDYDKSNLSNHIKELLHDELIESRNPDRISPPYKITAQGKKLLKSFNFIVFSTGLESYSKETVIRFLLRLPLISLFILVFPLPLLACPKRAIFQLFTFPLIIWGLLVRM